MGEAVVGNGVGCAEVGGDVGERGAGVGLEGGDESMLSRVKEVDGLSTEGI